MTSRAELVEQLAAIEHERWADWQRWVHAKAGPDPTHSGKGALLLLPEDVERWQRQISTPYAELSEREKQADRDQVARYWPVIVEFVADYIEGLGNNKISREAAIDCAEQWQFEMTALGLEPMRP